MWSTGARVTRYEIDWSTYSVRKFYEELDLRGARLAAVLSARPAAGGALDHGWLGWPRSGWRDRQRRGRLCEGRRRLRHRCASPDRARQRNRRPGAARRAVPSRSAIKSTSGTARRPTPTARRSAAPSIGSPTSSPSSPSPPTPARRSAPWRMPRRLSFRPGPRPPTWRQPCRMPNSAGVEPAPESPCRTRCSCPRPGLLLLPPRLPRPRRLASPTLLSCSRAPRRSA